MIVISPSSVEDKADKSLGRTTIIFFPISRRAEVFQPYRIFAKSIRLLGAPFSGSLRDGGKLLDGAFGLQRYFSYSISGCGHNVTTAHGHDTQTTKPRDGGFSGLQEKPG